MRSQPPEPRLGMGASGALITSGPEGMVAAAVLDRVVEDAGRDGSGEGRAGERID
jgi:hypothetical protein